MRLGIFDMLGLAASLIFAIPVGVFGVRTALDGQLLLGGLLIVIAVGMVVLPQYLTTPADLPGTVLERVAGTVAVEPDDASGDTQDPAGDDESRRG